jgi:hypothetical protein
VEPFKKKKKKVKVTLIPVQVVEALRVARV